MRNNLITFLVIFTLSSNVVGGEFVFNDEHLASLELMERLVVTPSGLIADQDYPVVILMKRYGLTPDAMTDAIVKFAVQCDRQGKLAEADSALGYLWNLGGTNAVPYLESYTVQASHTGYRTQALYSLRELAPNRYESIFQRLFHERSLTIEERESSYRGIRSECYAAAVLHGKNIATVREWGLLTLLRDLSIWEDEDSLRSAMDHTLCDFLDAWKFSDSRVMTLRHWAESRSSSDARFDWGRIADETEEAIRTGKTEWALLKDRPRPPSVPLAPDGSFKVPELPRSHIDDGEIPISPP